MFLANDVIQYAGPVRALRVLWVDLERDRVWTFELGQGRGRPRAAPLHVLEEDVIDGRARLLQHDPYAAPPAPPGLPPSHRALQAKAWAIVRSLQAQGPALYEAAPRAEMVVRCAQEHGVSRASVLRYLRRFWERGQSADALLPDYANSGARGKTRAAREGVKRGRPRKADGHPGLNVDAQARAIFRAAVARQRALQPAAAFSRRAAYRRMLDEFYPGSAHDAVPSFGQFSYWLEKDALPARPATAVAVQRGMRGEPIRCIEARNGAAQRPPPPGEHGASGAPQSLQ